MLIISEEDDRCAALWFCDSTGFIIRAFQMEWGRVGGCRDLLPSLLEVLWVKYNETSVMGGAGVITPMTHSPSSSTNILQQQTRFLV